MSLPTPPSRQKEIENYSLWASNIEHSLAFRDRGPKQTHKAATSQEHFQRISEFHLRASLSQNRFRGELRQIIHLKVRQNPLSHKLFVMFFSSQGANFKGTNRAQTQIFADICWFSRFPRQQSIGEAQIFAENHRLSQETAEYCRNQTRPQIGVGPLRFVPLSAGLVSFGPD